MPPYGMTKAEKQELFISAWKLQFGYEWINWDDAIEFRNLIVGVGIMISDLIDIERLFERNEQYNGIFVRIIPSEPVSIMEDV